MSGGIDLTAAMDALAAAVQTTLTSPRKCHAQPVEAVQPGDAVVGYPEGDIEVGITFGRGADRLVIPVYLIGGMPADKTTRDNLADFITGSGSLVTAIHGYSTSAWSDVSIHTIQFAPFEQVGGLTLVSVRFLVDIIS